MKIIEKATFLACLCCTLFSCSNVGKEAGERLQTARTAFERGNYSEVKTQIDSIRIFCLKAFGTRREGVGLIQQVELKEQEETLVYLDSMLQEKQGTVDAIKGSYTFKEGVEYQRMGDYLHPSQVTEENFHRSYLCFQVDENGIMSMTSIYYDPHNIRRLVMKVTAPDGSSAKTPTSRDNYETTDLGEKIGKVSYRVGEDGNVIASPNPNKDKNIRVNYLNGRPCAATMVPNDHKAIAAVYELVQLLSVIIEIKKNKDEASLKIEFVKRKVAEKEGREKEQVLKRRPSTLPPQGPCL